MLVRAIEETKSTDSEKLIANFEKGAKFDLLKAREGWFRAWDHQLIQEAYTFTVRPKSEVTDKWDFLKLGPAVPAANQPLESIYPTKEQNTCKL